MNYIDGISLATDGKKSLFLIESNPEGLKPLASSELLTAQASEGGMAARFGTQNRASIALSDGKLLIRDQSRMMSVKMAE